MGGIITTVLVEVDGDDIPAVARAALFEIPDILESPSVMLRRARVDATLSASTGFVDQATHIINEY